MFKLFVSIALLAFASLPLAHVIDPTKPLGFSGSNTTSGDAAQSIQLTSILISSQRKIAIINGDALGENQVVKGVGASVKRIDAEAVTLQQNGKIWRVALDNTAIRK